MKSLGLISLLITVAIASWWLSTSMDTSAQDSQQMSYQESISAAKGAADALEGRSAVLIYDGVTVSANTAVLDLSGRGLSGSLKAEVRYLSNIQEINLSNNNFTGIPAEVGQLSQMEVLNVSNNPITGLPHEIGNLRNLKVLDVRGTNYSVQDVEVIRRNLPELTVLTD